MVDDSRHDVFISYSSKDMTTADAICAVLERNGIRCWIAPRDVLPGVEWAESIIQAIGGAKVFVLLFSSSSNTSGQIRREVERAANREIPIIPFRLDEIAPNQSLEFFISSPHWMDAFTPPLEAHIQKLASNIALLLAKTATPGTPAAPAVTAAPAPAPPVQALRGWLLPALLGAALAVVLVVGAVLLLGRNAPAPTAPPIAATASTPQQVAVAVPPAPQPAVPPTSQPLPICRVADPTPTPLNVRIKPNGAIAQGLDNGLMVRVAERMDVDGKSWALIEPAQGGAPMGWVFSAYLYCGA